MKIYDYNELDYALNVLPDDNFTFDTIKNRLNDINNSSRALLDSININPSDTIPKIDLYNNIEKLFGYLFLLEFMRQFENEKDFKPQIVRELVSSIREKFKKPEQKKNKKWNITEKTFIGLMVQNNIKPRFYKNIFNVSKDSLSYQIKKFK